MRKNIYGLLVIFSFASSGIAMADNALTADQLLKSVEVSVKDYSAVEPDMARSISGLRTTTMGANAQVTIEMNADGMRMSAKYLCAPQGQDMACNLQ